MNSQTNLTVKICHLKVYAVYTVFHLTHTYLLGIRPGVYFRSKSLEGAFKRGGCLIQEGVYCYVSSKTLAQQQLLCSSWAAVSA